MSIKIFNISTQHSMTEGVSHRQLIAYSAPTIPIYFLMGPIYILQGMYVKYFGVSLSEMAMVVLVAKSFDAVSDLVIGVFSDWWVTRGGDRKILMLIGSALFVMSSWFLFVPDQNVTVMYILVWFIMFYLSYTLFVVPHYAWGGALVVDSKERNKIYSYRTMGASFGTLLFFVLPMTPFFKTSEFTPEILRWAVIISIFGMLCAIFLCLISVPSGRISVYKTNKISTKEYLSQLSSAMYENKPFVIFTGAYLCTGIGLGMWFSMLFLFVDSFLGYGSEFSFFYGLSLAVGSASIFIFYRLIMTWGKRYTWIFGMILICLGLLGTGFLSPMSDKWIVLMCIMLVMMGLTSFNISVPSLLTDIVDYGSLKSGIDRCATYFSVYTLLNKTVFAVSGAIGFLVADLYGFDPTESVVNSNSIFGLRLVMSWIPLVFVFLSIGFVACIPITLQRHLIIRRRLDAKLGAIRDVSGF